MTRKTILVLSPFYHPFIGGAEISVEEIIKRLSGDFNFIVFTTQTRKTLFKKEERDGIIIYRLGFGRNCDKYFYPFLALFKSYFVNFDIAYAVMASYGGLAALLIKTLRNKPYVLNLQSGTLDSSRKKWKIKLIAMLFKKMHTQAAAIHAISHSLKARALRLGATADRIAVIPNGTDLKKFNALFPVRNARRLVAAARLERIKGIDYLIRALPLILKKYPQTELLIIGDGSERLNLEKLIRESGLEQRVKLLGAVPHDQMPSLLNSGSIFVCPSLAEGFGIVCVEAMACGLTVIGTRVGGIPDIIQDKVNGLLIEPADSQAIAEAVIYLFDNPDFSENLAANALKSVGRYDWDNISQKVKILLYGA